MLAVALVLLGVAYATGWAALTGNSIVDELRSIIDGTPSDARARYRADRQRRQAAADRLAEGAPSGATVDPGERGAAARPTSLPTLVDESQLVRIGQGSHRLRADAAAAFKRAEARVGRTIRVTDSYRSYAQQRAAHQADPQRFADPNKSLHVKGIAIDIVEMNDPTIAAALSDEGWLQATWSVRGVREVWHWSYKERG